MADRRLDLVVNAGETLLASGGEAFRAQQTMEIMAESLQMPDFHVYVLTNGIFASAQNGELHAVRHIPSVSIHLGKVEAVNAISRQMAKGKLPLEDAEDALRRTRAMPSWEGRQLVLTNAIGSGAFGLLFGGGLPEMAVAFAAGAVETLICQLLGRHKVNKMFTDMASAASGTAVALLMRSLLLPALDVNIASISALMVLTPGVALTMGIRDVINGDYLSGTIRLLSALLVAACLAVGVAFAWTAAHLLLGVIGW